MSVSQSVFCGTSTYCVLNTVPPIEDDHGNSNSSHVKIFLPKKLLECLPKCSSLPKERHRWNTNEALSTHLFTGAARRGIHGAGAVRADTPEWELAGLAGRALPSRQLHIWRQDNSISELIVLRTQN
uniref:Calmodulin-binding transcription activator 1-like isoform X2 n=1 Tax=Camelus bactrianus TaxID=9837 RepID=A0A9W3G9R3_CAMBA|nr:calmodulin-binding transcription activator 1-like isoform X2 [Camelus bactrianus]XP_045374527.1 calmodulin-binding transcription activator 1-like isoform X3 [Camelus bactrianus]